MTKESGLSPWDLLCLFHEMRPWPLIAIDGATGKIEAADFAKSETRDREAQVWAEALNAAGYGIYFAVNPLKEPLGRKARKQDVLEARWMWVDCDPPNGLVGSELEAWPADKLAELRDCKGGVPPPTLIVDSGRGIWAFWRLRSPEPVDGFGSQTARVESFGRGLERAFDADACHNIERIARLPGFVNRKTGATARVLEYHPERACNLDELPSAPLCQSATADNIADELRDLIDDDAARAAVREYLRTRAPLAIEGRNGRTTTMRVLQRCQDLGCRFETATELMEEHWNDRCSPPWELGEIAYTLRGLRHNDPIGCDHPTAVERKRREAAERFFEDPLSGASVESDRANPRHSVLFKTIATFCGEFVPPSYAIEPIIRSASLYTLTAKTGAGKTAFNVITALAVATGRKDVLGREVACGRVAYLACENPDDIRMRIMIAAFLFKIDIGELGDRIVILDRREKPETVHAELMRLAKVGPFALIVVDTLAAFFDGDNINDNVQGGEFMRKLRPLTQVAGRPSVVVSAHPIKNAAESALVPYGGGAILNEVDGNLTLWKASESGIVRLHWLGKLRGVEFEPVPFRFEVTGSPNILDAKGQQVRLPTLRPSSEEVAEDRQQSEQNTERALLRAMVETPGATIRDYGTAIVCPKSTVERKLKRLEKEKLVEHVLDKWTVTAKGRKAIA